VDDGTDSEANFNNMVDSLTEEEAQILQVSRRFSWRGLLGTTALK